MLQKTHVFAGGRWVEGKGLSEPEWGTRRVASHLLCAQGHVLGPERGLSNQPPHHQDLLVGRPWCPCESPTGQGQDPRRTLALMTSNSSLFHHQHPREKGPKGGDGASDSQ